MRNRVPTATVACNLQFGSFPSKDDMMKKWLRDWSAVRQSNKGLNNIVPSTATTDAPDGSLRSFPMADLQSSLNRLYWLPMFNASRGLKWTVLLYSIRHRWRPDHLYAHTHTSLKHTKTCLSHVNCCQLSHAYDRSIDTAVTGKKVTP